MLPFPVLTVVIHIVLTEEKVKRHEVNERAGGNRLSRIQIYFCLNALTFWAIGSSSEGPHLSLACFHLWDIRLEEQVSDDSLSADTYVQRKSHSSPFFLWAVGSVIWECAPETEMGGGGKRGSIRTNFSSI